MLCPKCGCQIPDDSNFCEKCGAPVHTFTNAPNASNAPPGFSPPPQNQNGPKLAIVICAAVLCFLLLGAGVFLTAGKSSTAPTTGPPANGCRTSPATRTAKSRTAIWISVIITMENGGCKTTCPMISLAWSRLFPGGLGISWNMRIERNF